MKISILTTDPNHPVASWLKKWKSEMEPIHEVDLCFDKKELKGGTLLFLVSCSQMVGDRERELFEHVLVLHASNLPKRRGWSPHIWALIDGENDVTLCVLEASDPVDTGDIWMRFIIRFEGHELLNEINEKLFETEIFLMNEVVKLYHQIRPTPQIGDPGLYMRKRSSSDSELDISKSIIEQFNLLRTVDNERYPAYFDYRGHRYKIKIEKFEK